MKGVSKASETLEDDERTNYTESSFSIEEDIKGDEAEKVENDNEKESFSIISTEPDEVDSDNKFLVVIDPGHQSRGNAELEPIGPGATVKKAKVTGGTVGRYSTMKEYELTLAIGLKLREELVRRGYAVILTREENAVDISNAQRAAIANTNHADAFIRIHANGAENASVNGAMTICQTSSNPYNAVLYEKSRKLSEYILDNYVNATGIKKQKVWETDTMSGINWSNVPTTIIEMGYMTNLEDDLYMSDVAKQDKMVRGIADGIDAYFSGE